MNFNNPEDDFSSSPLSGDSTSPAGSGTMVNGSDEEEPTNIDDSPLGSNDDSHSSARLDAALRQAAARAGTQKVDLDNDEDLSMILTGDEVTASFKPWVQHLLLQTQQSDDPFSQSPLASLETGQEDDMSMDITQAVGRIVVQPESHSSPSDDLSMELTMPLGSIQVDTASEKTDRRMGLKRRASPADASQGSPAKRPTGRRASLRQPVIHDEKLGTEDQTMELTTAFGAIKHQASPWVQKDLKSRHSIGMFRDDDTMDFTVAVGCIKINDLASAVHSVQELAPEDEDLSMEFTNIVGPGIMHFSRGKTALEQDITSLKMLAPTAKVPTPNESPVRPRITNDISAKPSLPREMARLDPMNSPRRPLQSISVTSPEHLLAQGCVQNSEASPFVRRYSQSPVEPCESISTPSSQYRHAPLHIPPDPVAAPFLERRRSSLSSVQFGPLMKSREEPMLKSAAMLSNSIKLLSTPRKQTLSSPIKRGMTPNKSQNSQVVVASGYQLPTPQPATMRKSMSPIKYVVFGKEPTSAGHDADQGIAGPMDGVGRVSLQAFLELTRIRFMDLNTTKRRHTVAPVAFQDKELGEAEETLDEYVVAGACKLPEFELYQHACHEMKKYISDGRHFVRTMEANVLEENPLLFSEYLIAPPDQRAIMDNQFKNLKTGARLEARGEWYGWRSSLLQDLKTGLLVTMEGFSRDDLALTNQEQLLDAVLPPLAEKQEQLEKELGQLQQRHDELHSCVRAELEQAREQLGILQAKLEERRMLVSRLHMELVDKEACIEATKERKAECNEEIKAAEYMREECRGWSTVEVAGLLGKLDPVALNISTNDTGRQDRHT